MEAAPSSDFRRIERQALPWWWWAIGLAIWSTFVIAVLIVVPPTAAIAVGAVSLVLVVLGLLWWGRTAIEAEPLGLRVGRNLLEWAFVGDVRALDRDQARRRLGPDADANAWLAVRPWLPEAIEVTVVDRADPHPYWLIGCRDAAAAAASLNRARAAADVSASGGSGG